MRSERALILAMSNVISQVMCPQGRHTSHALITAWDFTAAGILHTSIDKSLRM